MHTRIVIVALLALGCAGSPEDAFVGRYSGSYACSGSWDDGSPYSEGPFDHTFQIDRGLDGGIFVAGEACTIPLEVVSATRASVVRSGCCALLPSGEEVNVTYRLGAYTLDEPQMSYRIEVQIWSADETGDHILRMTCDFNGTRIE